MIKEEYTVILHIESNDEIHLTIIPYKLTDLITDLLNELNNKQREFRDSFKNQSFFSKEKDRRKVIRDEITDLHTKLRETIYDNKVKSLMVQSYCFEVNILKEYNIVGFYHIPEMGH